MKNKFVYYDENNFEYKEIEEKYLTSPEKFKEYFGYLEQGKVNVFKLIPYKTFITQLQTTVAENEIREYIFK